MRGLQTSFELFLPKGFVDDDGVVHRDVTMRLATARDELEPLRDPRVRDAEDPFLTLVVLARVLTRIGPFDDIGAEDVCSLFAADLAYLQDCYSAVNFGTAAEIAEVVADAEGRRAEAEAEDAAFDEAAAEAAELAELTGLDAPVEAHAADTEADGHGLEDTIDAEALAAALQARFGEELDDALELDDSSDDDSDGDDESALVAEVVTSRRRHIEEVGVRSR